MAIRRAPFLAVTAALLLAVVLSPMKLSADTPEERVRKFQSSLGEKVVRDSRQELAGEEKRSVLYRFGGIAAAAVVLLAAASVLLSRRRARKSEEESILRYLTENLLTPEAVRDHLQRVVTTRTPLYLWIDDHFIKFSSHADELRAGEDGLRVLPVTPASGNDMLRNSRHVRIEYLYQKVPYYFGSTWTSEQGDRGSFTHLLAMPARIEFTQRREHYRVEPPLVAPILFRVMRRDLPPMGVLDIGMSGFSVATSTRLRPGETFAECRIEGGVMLPLDVSARCVYEFTFPENTSKYRFRYGFAITRFTDGNTKRLAHFIASQQLVDLSRRKAMES